jgi:hypothetical protein
MKSELRKCSRFLVVLQSTLDALQDECGAILYRDVAERIEYEPRIARSPRTAVRTPSALTESISAGELGKSIRNVAPSVWRSSKKSNYFFYDVF